MAAAASPLSLPDSAPIAAVIDALVVALGLASVRNILARKEAWVTALEEQMIFTLGSLRRLAPQRLGKLALPLLIEDELEKLLVHYAVREPLLTVLGVPRASLDDRVASIATGKAPGTAAQSSSSRMRVTAVAPTLASPAVKPNPLLGISARQRELLKTSWSALLTMKDFDNAQNDGLYQLAKGFYPNFFKANFTARRLFAEHDLAKQGSALVRMLAFIVKSLDEPESVAKPMQQLGGRHAVYGVERGDFVQFSQSLVETLLQILGAERFDAEAQRAWHDALRAMSDLLLDAGTVARSGYTCVVLREGSGHGASAWKKLHAHLTLDTLFLYADAKHKKLKGRFPMTRVDDISFPTAAVPNAFQLTCPETPFTLLLATESKQSLDEVVDELTWRLAALNRVYSESVESDTEASGSGSGQDSAGAAAHKATMHKAKHTTKQLQKRKAREGVHLPTPSAATSVPASGSAGAPLRLNISDEQVRALKASWETLVNLRDAQDPAQNGLTKFVDHFYPAFFAMNPSGVRLFKGTSMKLQGRALIKMIAVILRGIDDPRSVQDTLVALGGRHEIYGVEAYDYQQFAICLADTLEAVLGKKLVTDSVRDAWFKAIVSLSQVMLTAGRLMAQHPFRSPLLRLKGNGKWKRAVTGLSLTTLNLFDDADAVKLKTAYDLRTLLDVVVEEDVAAPSEFVFSVTLTEAPYKLTFAAESEDLFLKWIEEINWRMAAVQRVYVDEDDSASDAAATPKTSSSGSKADVKSKAKRVLGKTKHRRQKKDETRASKGKSLSRRDQLHQAGAPGGSLSASHEDDS